MFKIISRSKKEAHVSFSSQNVSEFGVSQRLLNVNILLEYKNYCSIFQCYIQIAQNFWFLESFGFPN